ncbi:MAG: hypothetical protein II992_00490 [Lachnospiraceae bacterium]|nr:hypothetical protein [Lachnospiraceae bacterium]
MSGQVMLTVASIILVEFMRGFTLSFAGFMALKHVFFRETKKFFCFSVCSGFRHTFGKKFKGSL